MKALRRQANTSYYVPDYTATSLKDVDFKALQKRGIKYVAIDADGTLVPFRGTHLDVATQKFLRSQKHLFKGWCIASNRLFYALGDLGKSIDAPVIQAQLLGRKPRREFFQRVIDLAQVKPEEIAMIGDKLLADVWGAKRSGLVTIWVEHMGQDNPWDRLFRTRQRERKTLEKHLSA